MLGGKDLRSFVFVSLLTATYLLLSSPRISQLSLHLEIPTISRSDSNIHLQRVIILPRSHSPPLSRFATTLPRPDSLSPMPVHRDQKPALSTPTSPSARLDQVLKRTINRPLQLLVAHDHTHLIIPRRQHNLLLGSRVQLV